MPIAFYVSDGLMLLFAIGAAVAAWRQDRHRLVPRWQLLLPGILGILSVMAELAFPEPRDLFHLGIWTVGATGLAVGAVRGAVMALESDHAFRLVRLANARDGTWMAFALVLFALLHFAAEMSTQQVNPYMPTAVLLTCLAGSYLAGRSLVGWIRADQSTHIDLRD
jgi:hypothetical protein